MTKIRIFLGQRILPVLIALATILFALIPDLLGIGTPGLGYVQISLMVIGCGLLIASLLLPQARILNKYNIGRYEILLSTTSFIFALILADIILHSILPPTYRATQYGWSVAANTSIIRTVRDTPDNVRQITLTYFTHGFKRWGTTTTNKKRLFIIGDSFTEMTVVSNGEEWYSYLEKEFNRWDFFVFGGGGYGSLQEYMILNNYIGDINPNIILWQFCTNDYANNLYEYDTSRYPYNNHAFRPYLEGQQIVYRLPLPFPSLRKYSFIGDRLLSNYDRNMWNMVNRDLDAYNRRRKLLESRETDEEKAKRRLMREKAYYVTVKIMSKIKEKAKETPVYMFNACGPISEREKKICKITNITCIPGISEYVSDREKEGYEVRVINDGHWNKEGNQFAGEKLVDYFKQHNIMNQ